MSEPRRSARIAQLQSHIVGNNGMIGYSRNRSNNRNQRRPNRNRTNALPINHGPPWTLQELKRKWNCALISMLNHHGIEEGHRWRKQDRVSALYNYGRRAVAADNQSMIENNEVDPGMTRLLYF